MRSLLQKLVLESVVDTVKLELTEAKAAAIYNIRAWKDTSIKGAGLQKDNVLLTIWDVDNSTSVRPLPRSIS